MISRNKVIRRRAESVHGDRACKDISCMAISGAPPCPDSSGLAHRRSISAQGIIWSPHRHKLSALKNMQSPPSPQQLGGQFNLLTFCNSHPTEQHEQRQIEQSQHSVISEAHCCWRGKICADPLQQIQGQEWLSFPAQAGWWVFPQVRERASSRSCASHAGEQCLAYKQHYRDSAFHGKLKGWPDSCLCMSGGDTAPLATYCNVVLLIKELHWKKQCLPFGLHTFPKANLLPQARAQEGQCNGEIQSDAQRVFLIQIISWLSKAYSASKNTFSLFPLKPTRLFPKASTRTSHLEILGGKLLKAKLWW